VAWRDKVSKRIYVVPDDGTQTPLAVSLPGQLARTPALAQLDENLGVVAWLTRAGSFRHQVWLAVTDGRTVSAPRFVMDGIFDEDVLIATGDGKGRVLLAVEDRSQGAKELKIMLVAPLVEQNGGLALYPQGNELLLNWTADDIFPAQRNTVETSFNLREWFPLSAGEAFSGRLPWAVGRQGSSRYFRLKPFGIP